MRQTTSVYDLKESTNMSQTTETTNETTEGKAPVKAAAKKTAPAKKVAAKASAKKPAGKATEKAPTKKAAVKKNTEAKETIRSRVFSLLAQHPDGLSGAEIMAELELGGIPALLKDEGIADTPRIKRGKLEGTRGTVYKLTALGKKAVDKGTVDSEAAESAKGKEWPEGR